MTPPQQGGAGPPRAPTMAAVARLAGVSQITVSRALNDPAKVSAATMARVREAVALTGYVPNLVAGALASRRSRLVAALMPSMTNPVYAGLVQQVARPLREAGYQVLIGETGIAREDEDALVVAVLSRRPDGLVMIGIDRAPQARRMLIASGLPVIELWDVSETPIDVAIGFSHHAAGEAVAAFARGRGRGRAAVVTAMDERALRRRDAFQNAFTRLGGHLSGEASFAEGASFGRGREGLARLLDDGQDPDCVFCSSDVLAHGVLAEARERRIAVPQHLGIVGFGDQDVSAHTAPALTTVRIETARLGRDAAATLLARIEGETSGPRAIDVGFEIVPRESC